MPLLGNSPLEAPFSVMGSPAVSPPPGLSSRGAPALLRHARSAGLQVPLRQTLGESLGGMSSPASVCSNQAVQGLLVSWDTAGAGPSSAPRTEGKSTSCLLSWSNQPAKLQGLRPRLRLSLTSSVCPWRAPGFIPCCSRLELGFLLHFPAEQWRCHLPLSRWGFLLAL